MLTFRASMVPVEESASVEIADESFGSIQLKRGGVDGDNQDVVAVSNLHDETVVGSVDGFDSDAELVDESVAMERELQAGYDR